MNSIFVWIPKTAGKSIYKCIQCSKLNRISMYRKFDNKGLVTFGHVDVNYLLDAGIISNEFFESSFKFAFVRNPWDRFVSLYFYKRMNKIMSMKDFCELSMEAHPICKNNSRGLSQCRPQSDWITRDGKIFVDFIGRFENIDEDFQKVLDTLNLNCKLNRLNKTKHKHFKEYYDKELIRMVGNLYEKDVDLFKYTF